MSKPPRSPPRFVPTLTEVVLDTRPAPLLEPLPPPVPEQPQPAAHLAELAPQMPDGFEELLVHRVMQRVDVGLDRRLRDAIATVVQEQTRSVLPRLREEVESVVRQVVYEAVAEELASKNQAPASKKIE
ncbi:hypothetical protein [Simplicispira psychrophila]|uniref:hypothetical protein n=1 Tax=Simplicispira psychrophila TaxID=80882 RepID=UPI0004844CE4|nr:hypothetical protein [Simplicispira psychrophila]